MPNKKVIRNIQIDTYDLNISNWPEVCVENLTVEEQNVYYRRKDAIIMYMKNEKTLKEISQAFNIDVKNITRLVKRCFELDNKGFIWGFRALVPNKRISKYERKHPYKDNSDDKKEIKKTGYFNLLIDKYPEIKEKIIEYYFDLTKDKVTDPVINLKYLHKKFIELCRMAGIKDTEYPFNTEYYGRISLFRFIKQLQNEYFYEEAKRNGDDAARIARSTGIGNRKPAVIRPFERVEFDGHKIDTIISITFTTPEGDEITVVLDRIWLLVIIDVATRVVLGHHLCLNREYSQSDVLHCIRNAVMPKKLKELTIPGLKYPENSGFASTAIPETKWARWDEFAYDNGKANLANLVRNRLTRIIKCSVNPGPVNMPERRGIIECFFGVLEENGYHRLINTTGSNPKDIRRKKPEEAAIKYQISVEELEELTEALIANYNNTPHDGINGFTPLQCMRHRIIDRKLLPRTIEEESRNEVIFLTLHDQRTVKGSVKDGKRPFIYFEGVEYRSDILSNSPDLIGKKLDLFINIDDIRVIRAFLPDGSEFGSLAATGKWGVVPHSLQLRKQINKLRNEKLIHISFMDDPIDVYGNFLKGKAKTNKRERNRLAALDRYKKSEFDNDTNSHQLIDKTDDDIAKAKETFNNISKFERKVVRTIVY